MDRYVSEALKRCSNIGLNPIHEPMGDSHHCDAAFTKEDKEIGDSLAWFLGSMFCDVSDRYFYHEMTSVDEWSRVARALRIHGLCISNAPPSQEK